MDEENENQEVVNDSVTKPINNSILTSIKKLLGITEQCTDFDSDIIMHINTVFMILNQLGVGEKTFSIEDSKAIWGDFLKDDTDLEAIKTYIHLKVRLIFDPPLSTAVREAIQNSINELEWRLNIQAESKKEEV